MKTPRRTRSRCAANRTAYIVASLLLLVFCGWLLDTLFPPPDGGELSFSFTVLDRQGQPLRRYLSDDGYWRLPIEIKTLDPKFIPALLAYEDKRFFQHPGVDPLALLRALGQAVSHGRVVSGASTLTMQTVRLLDPRPRTWSNKLLEMVRALQLERRLTKQQILSLYLNLAPYGGNIQGLRAASLLWFGKEPSFLTTDEIALLVALPQSPESRRPDRHPKNARNARRQVLDRFMEEDLFTTADLNRANSATIPGRHHFTRLAPHLADRILRGRTSEISVTTTLDATLQSALEGLLTRHQNRLGPGITLAALVVSNSDNSIQAYAGSGDYLATDFPGQIDMIQAIRSPGSALKPFLYGLAFDSGWLHPQTLILDRPMPQANYAPDNFDRRFRGEITVAEALQRSRNLPAIRVINRLGPRYFVDSMTGIGTPLRLPRRREEIGPAVALGGLGITLQELTNLYSTLANRGDRRPLFWQQDGSRLPSHRLLSAESAYHLTDILRASPRPRGFHHNDTHLAFKTGTSYGYRDAWALGYNAKQTASVWVGRPDGGYTARLNGLNHAAPVLLEIFDLLPETGLQALLIPPAEMPYIASNQALPKYLRRLHEPLPTQQPNRPEPPRITYPLQESLITLRPDEALQIDTKGGVLPFNWLLDSRPLQLQHTTRQLLWKPQQPGFVEMTLIDAKGQSTQVGFYIALTP